MSVIAYRPAAGRAPRQPRLAKYQFLHELAGYTESGKEPVRQGDVSSGPQTHVGNRQSKRMGCSYQVSQGGGNTPIFAYESPVEVAKPKEGLHLLDCGWLLLEAYCIWLLGVWSKPPVPMIKLRNRVSVTFSPSRKSLGFSSSTTQMTVP